MRDFSFPLITTTLILMTSNNCNALFGANGIITRPVVLCRFVLHASENGQTKFRLDIEAKYLKTQVNTNSYEA